MNSQTTRLILELVLHHGELEVPELRVLSLAVVGWKPMLELVKEALKKQKFYCIDEERKERYTYYISRDKNLLELAKYYEGKIFHGTFVSTFQRLFKVQYIDGKREGVATTIHKGPYGLVHTDMYLNGEAEGESRTVWTETGVTTHLQHWKSGKQHGLRKTWSNEGVLISEDNFINGEREGICREWEASTVVVCHYPFTQSEITYYLRTKSTYKDGRLHGTHTTWDFNGNLARRTEWFEGNEILYRSWNFDGIFKYEAPRNREGKHHGTCIACYGDGRISDTCEYVNGVRHGEHKSWNENGTVRFRDMYVDGVLVPSELESLRDLVNKSV